jgi:hypothetical protein
MARLPGAATWREQAVMLRGTAKHVGDADSKSLMLMLADDCEELAVNLDWMRWRRRKTHRAMEHRTVLAGLRAGAQRYTEAAQRETVPHKKRKLAVAVGGLSLLTEQLERGATLTAAHIEAYQEMLADVLNNELRAVVDKLFGASPAA